MIAQRIIRPREVPHPAGDLPGDIHPVIQRVLLARGVSSADELSLGLKDMLLPDGLGGVVRVRTAPPAQPWRSCPCGRWAAKMSASAYRTASNSVTD
jgi:hypothetical protein